jgi:hypothetical protein
VKFKNSGSEAMNPDGWKLGAARRRPFAFNRQL